MFKVYQELWLVARSVLLLLLMALWPVVSFLCGCLALGFFASKAQSPPTANDALMLFVLTFWFILPGSVALPGIVGFIAWAPIDLLLGLISGEPVLLLWVKDSPLTRGGTTNSKHRER